MDALVAGPRDFCMPLSDIGSPDQDVAEYWKSCGFDGGDPGLAKWTVQQGRGPCLTPQELYVFYFHGDGQGTKAEVHFTGKTLDGNVFVSSRENGTTVTFMLTQENVIDGFKKAIATMQPGEKAVFTIPPEFAVANSGCPSSIPWNIPHNQTLRFDIELISLITDVLEDQGILKKTTELGSGEDHPSDFDEVFVKYNACLKDGTSVSTSEGVEFSLAEGFFCPAFAQALKTMTKGEEAVLIIKPKYGFGEQGRPAATGNEAPVSPDATLHINLQLVSWLNAQHRPSTVTDGSCSSTRVKKQHGGDRRMISITRVRFHRAQHHTPTVPNSCSVARVRPDKPPPTAARPAEEDASHPATSAAMPDAIGGDPATADSKNHHKSRFGFLHLRGN